MVNHETYRDAKGRWVPPSEVAIDTVDGKRVARHVASGEPVTIGSVEKMSKSKKNTVDPEDIIAKYGADTARWFMLSDSPPERDVQWTDQGAEGAWRFTQRLWRMVTEKQEELAPKGTAMPAAFAENELALRRAAHQALAAATEDFENLRFNRAVARVYELANAVSGFTPATPQGAFAKREALEILVQIVGPMMPHIAEECWEALGHGEPLTGTQWPVADKALLVEDSITIAVQVNGKRRDELTIARDADRETVERAALALEKVEKAIDGKAIRKVIVVPGKIVNIVV